IAWRPSESRHARSTARPALSPCRSSFLFFLRGGISKKEWAAKARGGFRLYHYSATLPHNATTCYNVDNSMTEISSKLGLNLKRIRIKKKMSQGDIARALEVHRAYVSGIENGKRNPTLATIKKLSDALGVSADELLK
ncbi:MAG: hypothetical protein UY67_C0029G0001, partial [Candidatus Kaiserbacteria bacterium GW2011_GWA2_52_12]